MVKAKMDILDRYNREGVMKLKVCVWSICVFALTSLALAQGSVDGKWAGEIQGGRGPQAVTLTLKADGGK